MRLRFMFWLDLSKEDEFVLSQHIRELKLERTFVKAVRDGLRLVNDLKNGRTDVLRELFPWVLEQRDVPPVEEIIGEYVTRLEGLMAGRGGGLIAANVGNVARSLPLGEAAKRPAQPLEEMLEIREAQRSADDKPTWNFMISSALSVYGHCRFLPPDIQEYGLRTGRIPPHALPDTAEKPNSSSSVGSAKKMKVPEFKPPAFDDDGALVSLLG